jgi:virginiamycin B lyase
LENAELTETRRRAFAAVVIFIASACTASAHTITEFPISMAANTIVTGSDGALWFASHDRNKNTVGRITTDGAVTEFPIPVLAGTRAEVFTNLAVGPDGALWFGLVRDIKGQLGIMSVGRITTAGAISELHLPSASHVLFGIAAGPDGALWFTEANDKKIGRMTTTGEFTEFPLPSSVSPHVFGITAGPDGALWYVDRHKMQIGRITTAGAVTEFPRRLAQVLIGITAGPDGALWFTDCLEPQIGRITSAGVVTKFRISSADRSHSTTIYPNTGFCGIIAGPDGALWFTETFHNKIGRITTSGDLSEFLLPTPDSYPAAITTGPDGAMWFTERDNSGGKIGRIVLTDEDSTSTYRLRKRCTYRLQKRYRIRKRRRLRETRTFCIGKSGCYT